jgi:hypothetical protein
MTREIPLTQGLVALVDDQDYELVTAAGKWRASVEGRRVYAKRDVRRPDGARTSQRLHQLITGNELTDHRNGDGLDNRRTNLRPASKGQNGANRGPNSNNKAGFKGVSWDKVNRRWRAQIQVDGKIRNLGRYGTPEGAALAYDAAAREYFGEFAALNFPTGVRP